jgi:hypothetical protein
MSSSFERELERQTRDMARRAKQQERDLENKISTFILRLILIPIFLILFVIGIWYVARKMNEDGGAPPAKAAAAGSWDGQSTFECKGNDVIELSGQTAELSASPAISAKGNCKLTLTDMNITAPVVIQAESNAEVTVSGGTLTGSTKSIVAKGNASVTVEGAKVSGATEASANGKITGVP